MAQDLIQIVTKLDELLSLATKLPLLLISDSDLYQLKGIRSRLMNKVEKLAEKEQA